jgi:hypothetical protein
MQTELTLRFDYGTVVPWVTRLEDNRLCAVAGPDRIVFYTTVALRGENLKTRADFEVEEGQTVPFALTWSHSFGSLPSPPDAAAVRSGGTEVLETQSCREGAHSQCAKHEEDFGHAKEYSDDNCDV